MGFLRRLLGKGKTNSPGSLRPRGGNGEARLRRITLFHSDDAELQAVEPVGHAAGEKGYDIHFSEDPLEPAEIGIYCSHSPNPANSILSIAMLHSVEQEEWPESPSREPNFWSVSPWDGFDIGVLPGRAWSECWRSVSWQTAARPRVGVFELGYPKADFVFRDRKAFNQGVQQLRESLRLRYERSVLYAPSFENDGKEDDFVRSLLDMPVNLLIKQANWPEENARIREMTERHQGLGDNVYIIDPRTHIMQCLALSDVVVSEESNCMAEALVFDVPAIAVMDWPVPALPGLPERYPDRPPSFIHSTVRGGLREAVQNALKDPGEVRARMRRHRDHYFSHLGESAALIVEVLDSALTGAPFPVKALAPMERAEFPDQSSGPRLPEREQFDEMTGQGPTPEIEDFGPRPVKAGVPFNVQPSGKSALWFKTRHITYRTVVVFDNRELRTVVSLDGKIVTAVLPDDLFQIPGEYAIYLFDKIGRKRSGTVRLVVE